MKTTLFQSAGVPVFLFLSAISALAQEPPKVTIVRPLNGSVVDGEQIRVEYVVSGTEPKSVKIMVDDKAVQLLTEVQSGDNAATVDLPSRDCKISVVAQNEFGAGVPAAVNLKRNEYIFKPSLYILAVGVSNYDHADLRLQFPAKDATDFTQSLIKQAGQLYESVDMKLFTDRRATAENIREGLQWLRTQTTSRDVAMLYMAGHGVNDNIGDFYFMPVNADVGKINATCVSYTDIKATVSAVAGKLLVFMDACHSGNVLGRNTQRAAVVSQAVLELAEADNGPVVYTSSTGRQYSLEDSEWNNGAFTKAAVEGLTGAAELPGRGTVTVKSLDYYITNRVKELTGGQQSPTTIIPTGVPDFPIAVVNASAAGAATANAEAHKTAGADKASGTINRKTDSAALSSADTGERTSMRREASAAKTDRDKASKTGSPDRDAADVALPVTTYAKPAAHGKHLPFYAEVNGGADSFGGYSGAGVSGGGQALGGASAAYFFTPHLGAGFKMNMTAGNVNFGAAESLSFHERLLFMGPAMYGRWGKTLVFSAGLGFGALNWQLTDVVEYGSRAGNESYTSAGGFVTAGVGYMFTRHVGLSLNMQSVLGELKTGYGEVRNPAGLGGTLGIGFRF